jgi:hypothetical protein
MVGCLLYVGVCSRPDIQFSASALARYMSCPTKELVKHAIHVFRYLTGTVELALEFQDKGQPVCYVDADYGGDAATRRLLPLAMRSCCLVHAYPGRVGCSGLWLHQPQRLSTWPPVLALEKHYG